MSFSHDASSIRNDQLLQISPRAPVPWVWDGVVAERAFTLFSAPEKTGKTTLLSLLLDKRRVGGQLLGRAVRPGRTILCSEESEELWRLRQPPLDFGSELEFHNPRQLTPTRKTWWRFINYLLDLDVQFDLVVIDTLMTFLPGSENNPRTLRQALHILKALRALPAGILLLHQQRAVRGRSRSRGPLAAFADILIDMRVPPGDPFTRRRDWVGVGRYPGTLQRVSAELNAEGTDYLLLPDAAAGPAVAPMLATLQSLLRESPAPLSCQEIIAHWPAAEPPPRSDSLMRSLRQACDLGLLVRTGSGTKFEAFRYALAEAQAVA